MLNPLLRASMSVQKAGYIKDSIVAAVEIENHSDAHYVLENKSGFALHGNADVIQLPPHDTTRIRVMTLKTLPSFDLKFKVWNAVTAPGEHPEISLKVEME